MRSICSLIILLLPSCFFAQFSYELKIMDINTKRAVPFANVAAYKNGFVGGASSDLNGIARIKLPEKPDSILISCVGYKSRVLRSFGLTEIYLNETETSFSEVLINPGENPANRIMRNVLANSKKNDIVQSREFSHKAYTIFKIEADQIDTALLNGEQDTAVMKAYQFFLNKHAFVSEVYSKFYKKPVNFKKERIVQTQTSGAENPLFSALAAQSQPFSAYTNPIALFGTEHLNPISNAGLKGYFFILQDTIFSNQDSIFVVDFYPKPGSVFKSSQGTFYINQRDWSIKQVVYNFENPFANLLEEDRDTIQKPQQEESKLKKFENPATLILSYEQLDSIWVPKEVKTIMPLGELVPKIPVFISNSSFFTLYRFDNHAENFNNYGVSMVIEREATQADPEFWQSVRGPNHDSKIDSTYQFMDSVVTKNQLDRLFFLLQSAMDGKLSVKFLDIDLAKTLIYNDFEGFRLGTGIETNERFIKFLSLGGFFGYGLRDKAWKYGGNLKFILFRDLNTHLNFAYAHDIWGTGVQTYRNANDLPDPSFFTRRLYIDQMDYIEDYGVSLSSYLYRGLHLSLKANSKTIRPSYAYVYASPNYSGNATAFDVFETEASIFWRLKEDAMQIGRSRILIGNYDSPTFYLSYKKGWSGLLNGQFDFQALNFRYNQKKSWLRLGSLEITADYQLRTGDLPLPLLIFAPGTRTEWCGLGASKVFETAGPNEFLHDQYAAAFLKFDFNKIVLIKKYLEPAFSLRFNAGFGTLQNPERHPLTTFDTMNRGYFETGLVINNLLKQSFLSYGLGVFYRLPPYAFANEGQNFAVKLTLSLAQ